MANPNQRISPPFGDIFFPNVSATDKLSAMIYNDQRQREAQQAAENQRLDNEFGKNLSNVRDIDIAPITEAYGEWKTANKKAIKKKQLTPQEQLDLLKKKAEMYKRIETSKTIKAKEQEVRKMGDKPNPNLQDDWQVKLSESIVTPIGKNTFVNYNHVYDGADYKDATKDMTSWMGKPQKGVLGKPVAIDKQGLQTKTPLYDFPSDKTGDQVLNSALIGMTKTRDASKYWQLQAAKIPDEEYLNINEKYKALPKDKWDLLGKGKPVLDVTVATDPLTRYATHIAQIHELNNIPTESGFKTETNRANLMDAQEAMRKRLMNWNSALIEGRTRRNPHNGQTYEEGIVFDATGSDKPVEFEIKNSSGWGSATGKIVNGTVTDDKGNPYTGQLTLKREQLPAEVITVLKKGGMKDIETQAEFKVNSDAGTITSVGTKLGTVDRKAIRNYQLSYDKEPQKGEKLDFGKRREAQGNLPVGTVLTGKDGKKIKTTKPITKKQAEEAGYKIQ